MSFEMPQSNFDFNFHQIYFNPFKSPDENIFQDDRYPDYLDEINILSKETTYINETDIKNFLYETHIFENIPVLRVNIRGLKTYPNFENFRNVLNNTGSSFNIICLTETWCSNFEIINSYCFDRNNYKAIPFEKKTNKRRGSILLYVKTDLMHKIRKDLSIFDKDNKILTIEIISKKVKTCCFLATTGLLRV